MAPSRKPSVTKSPTSASPEPSGSSSHHNAHTSTTAASLKRKASKAAIAQAHTASKKRNSSDPQQQQQDGADTSAADEDEEAVIRLMQQGGYTRHQIAATRATLRQQREDRARGGQVVQAQEMAAPPAEAAVKSSSPANVRHPDTVARANGNGDGEEDDDDEEEEKKFCLCRCTEEEAQENMIACEGGCDEWYHAACVNLTPDELAAIDTYICARCEAHTTERTTYKPPCSNAACKNLARLPLSRYCSEQCGVLTAVSRLQKTKVQGKAVAADRTQAGKLLVPSVRLAQKRESRVIWAGSSNQGVGKAWLSRWTEAEAEAGPAQGQDEEPTECQGSVPPLPTAHLLATHAQSHPREVESLVQTHADLVALVESKVRASTALDLTMARISLLQCASDRATDLPYVGPGGGAGPATAGEEALVAGSSSSSSSKKKGKPRAKVEEAQPRCGYDERLSWGDEAFARWASSEDGKEMLGGRRKLDGWPEDESGPGEDQGEGRAAGQGEDRAAGQGEPEGEGVTGTRATQPSTRRRIAVCPTAKKRCKRHAEWAAIRNDDFTAEKTLQETLLERLSREEPPLRARIDELSRSLREMQDDEDKRLAGSLAERRGR